MTQIELDKTYHFTMENYTFGELPIETLTEIFRDGRPGSYFLEAYLPIWFPELTHVKGCKDHDHHDASGQLYDAKNFTKNGLNFKPSKMLGTGRVFNYQGMVEKASKLVYIACDIVEFPKIRVIFKDGRALVREFPNGKVPKSQREVLFS
jgi:hypothetical protein